MSLRTFLRTLLDALRGKMPKPETGSKMPDERWIIAQENEGGRFRRPHNQ